MMAATSDATVTAPQKAIMATTVVVLISSSSLTTSVKMDETKSISANWKMLGRSLCPGKVILTGDNIVIGAAAHNDFMSFVKKVVCGLEREDDDPAKKSAFNFIDFNRVQPYVFLTCAHVYQYFYPPRRFSAKR